MIDKLNVIIFGEDTQSAFQRLEDLIKNEVVLKQIRTVDFAKVITENKEYRAMKWTPNCRGYKANELHIDSRVDEEKSFYLLTVLVRPLNYKDDWKWKDHVHYF